LHHQHVAQVYEVGVADDGTYFLAMEYLHGETVRATLGRARHRHVRLTFDYALTVIASAASGLHHAHERRGNDGQPLGIVHRDVSPSNIICGYDGSVKLIDFGIAKATERSTVTQTGFVKGKAGYMAPEQALGYKVDRRSDVYALGVVMYELCTQHRAFRAASEHEAVQRMVRGDVTPPSKLVAGFPRDLEDVILHALELDPDDRFRTCEEMRQAVERVATQLGAQIGPGGVVRVLGDLFGERPEPWLAGAPLADEAGEQAPTTESAVLVAMSGPASQPPMSAPAPVPLPEPVVAALAKPIEPAPPPAMWADASKPPRPITNRPGVASQAAPATNRPRTQTLPPPSLPPIPPRTRTITVPPMPVAAQPAVQIAPSLPPPPLPPIVHARAPSKEPEDQPTSRFTPVEDLRVPGLAPAFVATERSRAPTTPLRVTLPMSPTGTALPVTSEPIAPRAIAVGTAPPPFVPPMPMVSRYATGVSIAPSRARLYAIGIPCAIALGVIVALWIGSGGGGADEDERPIPETTTTATTSPSPSPSPSKSTTTTTTTSTSTSTSAPVRPERSASEASAESKDANAGVITIHVVSDPIGATVVLDGARLGTAPYTGTFAAQPGKEAILKVRMHGYVAIRQPIPLDHDYTWNVELHRAHDDH